MVRLGTVAAGLALLGALLAGCGGGGGSGAGGGDNRPSGGAGLNGISLSNCLIDENWLIQPSQDFLEGQTPDGSNVHIDVYKTPAEATKKAIGVAGAVPVSRVVVTFIGNKTPYEAGKTLPKANRGAVNAIKACVKKLGGT